VIGAHALHTCEQFSFVAHAPLDVAWPLFGAEGEKAWAPGWDPAFIWPAQPADREGMVFTIRHGLGTATWVNTAFDRQARRIQYVYVIPEVVATLISLHLLPQGEATRVAVTYERTALSEAAAEQVRMLAEQDKAAGEEWSRQIDGHLRARR
jgi:hypothetical protein